MNMDNLSPPLTSKRSRRPSWSPPLEEISKRAKQAWTRSRSSSHGSDSGGLSTQIVNMGVTAGAFGGIARAVPESQTHTNNNVRLIDWRHNVVISFPVGFHPLRELSEAQKDGVETIVKALADTSVEVGTTDDGTLVADAPSINIAHDSMKFEPTLPGAPIPPDELFEYPADNGVIIIGEKPQEHDELLNTVDIHAYTAGGSDKVPMRALLDTCSPSNFISSRKAHSTRHKIKPYTGRTRFFFTGGPRRERFTPTGEIVITFHRMAPSADSARSYQVKFLVVEDDVPFDVVLGVHFCRHADVFRNGDFFCPLFARKQTKEKEKKQKEKEEAQLKANEADKIKDREAAEEREKRKKKAQAKAGPSTQS